ncbi:Nose resistant to fluoxetine protein 6 [Trachymyrmex cornetzi]|uniref:Nose resistant to fluoxetine protein 6 n=1 Tax=Trachymyrmex cornetzi TaxID=471704 RepID=A0A195E049_9HYME|nr:Nose resistant to fluoxetine protein 6 [Trachymyrmex cornetzi]
MHYIAFISYVCHFVTLFCVSAQFHGSNGNNIIHFLPAYAIASRASLLGSATCATELRDFLDAVDQRILWGLKTLDSSGGLKSGFLYGNNFWLGSRSQCLDIMNRTPFEIAKRHILNNTRYRDPQNEFPPFQLNYFVAYIRHNSTLQYHINIFNEDQITLGLCLPASCTMNNISFILEGIFRDRVLLINDLYSMDLSLIQVKNLKDDHQWLLSGAIPFICVALVFSFAMMISGTIYDIFIYQTHLKAKTKTVVNEENTVKELQTTDLSSSCEKSKIENALMCFSVYTNTKIIFNTKLDTEEIAVIHGIRFLTMLWIITIHTVFFTLDYFDNKIWMLRTVESVPMQVLANGTVSVDTYFFLSGFLLVYTNLKNKTDKERIKSFHYKEKLNEFFVSIMKRCIRLTPAYVMMIGISQLTSVWYDKTSQFYVHERPHETCAKYWWRNVLYIHNLFDPNTMCSPWSWYLSCDMQFFIIGLALLILSTVYFYVAVVILSTILIASVILSGYISYIYEFVPTLDEQYRLVDILYIVPWMRIGPYIIGMITGYIIKRFNKKIALKKCLSWSWYLSSDMQFFIIGLALLILSTVYFYVAVVILSTILIASVILSGYISYIYEFVPTFDEQYRLKDVLYFPPWIRIGPYIIGMITGYIIRRFNKKIALKKNVVILYWILGAACNILVLFGLYNRQISVLSTAIYVALSRTVWAIGIAWIVIMCCTEHGGIIKELLSWKIWIPLSRLTYCAYLINPVIIRSISLNSETSVHSEFLPTITTSIGYLVISYFCAYALSLTVESPYILLMQMFRQSLNRKRTKRL